MNDLKIIKAGILDFEDIKSLMLKALEEDPNAFTVSRQEYEYNSKEWWTSYLSPYTMGVYSKLYFLKDNQKNVGMIGLSYTQKERSKHVANIFWVWIQKDYRGKGYSKKLIEKAIEEIKSNSLIKKISLTVVASQIPAINLYKKFGFEICGIQKSELLINNQFYDFIFMEKFLK